MTSTNDYIVRPPEGPTGVARPVPAGDSSEDALKRDARRKGRKPPRRSGGTAAAVGADHAATPTAPSEAKPKPPADGAHVDYYA
jgi:hypothetical protein